MRFCFWAVCGRLLTFRLVFDPCVRVKVSVCENCKGRHSAASEPRRSVGAVGGWMEGIGDISPFISFPTSHRKIRLSENCSE